MTSRECFVYLQLPNSVTQVTVGRLSWQSSGPNTDVGSFVYGKNYLKHATALPLDPFELRLEEKLFQTTKNEGIHGPIRDASPDSWGRYVIEKNTSPSEHNPIGYLLNSAGDRIGALSFGVGSVPPAPVRKFNKTVDLNTLIAAAHKLEEGLPLDETEKALLMIGPSAGGARPKTTVEYEDALWIAKFPALNDKQNYSRIEYATMQLAKSCGLNVPEVRIVQVDNKEVFLIKRFDRQWSEQHKDYFRTHFVSGLTLLNIDENDREKWSYIDLADQMRRWITKPTSDLHEMFKRIVFNALVANTDDHPRNHGFIYTGNGYKLSPVYDLVPRPEFGSDRYSAMEVGVGGRIFSSENILSKCEAFYLDKNTARGIFRDIMSKVSQWQSFFLSHKVSQKDVQYLEGAFNHNASTTNFNL